MIARTGFLFAVIGLMITSAPAAAQSALCASREHMVTQLMSWGERLENIGLQGGHLVIEVWSSDKSTFTVLATWPSGVSCVLAHGDQWSIFKLPDAAPAMPGQKI